MVCTGRYIHLFTSVTPFSSPCALLPVSGSVSLSPASVALPPLFVETLLPPSVTQTLDVLRSSYQTVWGSWRTYLTCFWSLVASSLSLWHLSSSCLLSSSSLIFLISSAWRWTSSSLFARSCALRRAISSLANLWSKTQEQFGPSCCSGIRYVYTLHSQQTSPAPPVACAPPPPSPSVRGPAGGSQPGFGSPPLGLWCLLRACGVEDWLHALKRKQFKL